jgi:hypothetical protein
MKNARKGLVWLIALAGGCGGEESTGLDLTLVPDPNVNRPEDVVRLVDSLVLVLDAPGGLYRPGGEAPRDGTVQIEDTDGDPSDLELVATMPLGDQLPWIRIEQGGLPGDASLELLLLGLPAGGGEPVARGGAQGIALGDGRVDVPFNLVPSRLPPRIAEVVPADGDVALDCFVGRVVVVFSKRIEPASFLEPGAVVFDPGGAPTELSVDASGRFGEVIPPPLQGDETVRYHLTVTTVVEDEAGRPLDQIPAEAGAQPFERDFVLPCQPGPQIPDPNCGDAEPAPRYWCRLGARFECVEGMCLPTSCDGATCADPTVCDPATATCEVDCRHYGPDGACDEARPLCDGETGVCVARE